MFWTVGKLKLYSTLVHLLDSFLIWLVQRFLRNESKDRMYDSSIQSLVHRTGKLRFGKVYCFVISLLSFDYGFIFFALVACSILQNYRIIYLMKITSTYSDIC